MRAPSVDLGETTQEAVTLRFALLRPNGIGVLVEERIQWTEPIDRTNCGYSDGYCQDASSTDVFEMRWSRKNGGFDWETPGPGPNFWDCTLVDADLHLDCTVTHQDGHEEVVPFTTRRFGRDGPPPGFRDEKCVYLTVVPQD